MSTPSETMDLCKILSETRRIIRSHIHHFQLLSLLFLLPLSFSIIIIYPTLHKTIFNSQPVSTFPAQILINLLCIFFMIILFICGIASISYSAFHSFYDTPPAVDLITSIKSISQSFFPLLYTLIFQELIITWPFVYQTVRAYASESFYKSSPYYVAFIILLSLAFLLGLIQLRAEWILAYVIIVVESNWGLEPLKRSGQLVKGKERVAFSMVLVFCLMVGAPFWGISCADHGMSWGFMIFYMVGSLVYLTMVLLLSLVANVVLYVNCLEMHGDVLPYSS